MSQLTLVILVAALVGVASLMFMPLELMVPVVGNVWITRALALIQPLLLAVLFALLGS